MKSANSEHPYLLQPYLGYGNSEKFSLKGRVLENEQLLENWSDSKIRNLWETWKRIETDEISDAKVGLTIKAAKALGGKDLYQEVLSDEEGYFHFESNWQYATGPGASWQKIQLDLIQPKIPELPLSVETEVFIPSQKASFGIISDVDDTVLQTHMTSRLKLKMMYVSFMKGAHQRIPMEGMKTLLEAFTSGEKDQLENPIFYVSNSPWNIYDILSGFIEIQELPKGPLMLRDFGMQLIFKTRDHVPHKLKTIRHILETYPHLPFIFLGDTASNDADYYLQMEKEFPGRVKAIYIRETKDTRNARRIRKLFEEVGNPNFVIVERTEEIMEHAGLKS